MKKILLVAIASMIALSSAASAQTFDLNAMPLSSIPTSLDKVPTGSVATSQLQVRYTTRDGVSYAQYYKLNEDGSIKIVSEKQN